MNNQFNIDESKRRIIGLGIILPVIIGSLLIGALLLFNYVFLPGQLLAGDPETVANAAAARPQAAPVLAPANLTVELCAKAGTATMVDGVSVDIWGFAIKPTGVPCSDSSIVPQLPGPVLAVTEGGTVDVTLHNDLSENVSLQFVGQNEPPDLTGVANGGNKTYSFIAKAGSYLYESGTNVSTQVPMGLYGALIVYPATTGQAYGSAASAYDVEAILVLSEIDPALNANPGSFNLLDYAPKYWLINGEAYPDTDLLTPFANARLLVRYLNAGHIHHTMTLLGTGQQVIAMDGYELTHPFDVVAQTIPSGQTMDTIVAVPGVGSRVPLYNRQLHLTNGSVSSPDHYVPGGGMMTFIEAAAGGPTPTPVPTDTPIPPTVTDTPVPGPTDTPVPGPTDTPEPPTATPVPPTPTDTPVPPTPTNTPLPTNTLHVGDLDMVRTRFMGHVHTVTITVHDSSENPLAGVLVNGTWSGGSATISSCFTNASGQCNVVSALTFDPLTYTVDNLTSGSLIYAPGSNHDPDGDSDGTSITQ